MLVLSRKESQRIRLGDSIVITIVKISGDKVRVGIEAPDNVLVLRDELELHHPPTSGEASPATVPDGSSLLRHSA
jgi:carbon storage regulator